jgi:hypothetical protein
VPSAFAGGVLWFYTRPEDELPCGPQLAFLTYNCVSPATDYVKRENVLRVRTRNCGDFLLQVRGIHPTNKPPTLHSNKKKTKTRNMKRKTPNGNMKRRRKKKNKRKGKLKLRFES